MIGMIAAKMTMVLALAGGENVGLPFGTPPAKPDPLLARVAPEKCLYYLSWEGTAAPDPNSANHTERMIAEPEVQYAIKSLGRLIERGIELAQEAGPFDLEEKEEKAPDDEKNSDAEEKRKRVAPAITKLFHTYGTDMALVVATHPTAFYVSDVKLKKTKTGPEMASIRGGLIVHLGKEAKTFAKPLAMIAEVLADDPQFSTITIGGTKYAQYKDNTKGDDKAPLITWAVVDNSFRFGIGKGAIEEMNRSLATGAPAWLTKIKRDMPVDRISIIQYVDLREVFVLFRTVGGPDEDELALIKALGLESIESYADVTGLDKTGRYSRARVTFDGPAKGVFKFLGGKPLTAASLAPIPRDARLALAAKIDPEFVLDTTLEIAKEIDKETHDSIVAGIENMKKMTKIDLRKDLLKSLGDEWTMYYSTGEGGSVFTGLTAVVTIRDRKQLAKTHQKLLTLAKKALQDSPNERNDKGPPRKGKAPPGDGVRLQNRGEKLDPAAVALVNNAQIPFPPIGGNEKQPEIKEFKFLGHIIYYMTNAGDLLPVTPAWCMTDKHLIVSLYPQNIKAFLIRGKEYRSLADIPSVKKIFAADEKPITLGYYDSKYWFEMFYPWVQMAVQFGFSQADDSNSDLNLDINVIPSTKSIGRHLRPGVITTHRTNRGFEIRSRHSLPGLGPITTMIVPSMLMSMAEIAGLPVPIGGGALVPFPAPVIGPGVRPPKIDVLPLPEIEDKKNRPTPRPSLPAPKLERKRKSPAPSRK